MSCTRMSKERRASVLVRLESFQVRRRSRRVSTGPVGFSETAAASFMPPCASDPAQGPGGVSMSHLRSVILSLDLRRPPCSTTAHRRARGPSSPSPTSSPSAGQLRARARARHVVSARRKAQPRREVVLSVHGEHPVRKDPHRRPCARLR